MQALDRIKDAARGQWRAILEEVGGIAPEFLDGKHRPCPKCGGNDRFRFIDEDAGAVLCNQCFREKNGDGISALRWMLDLSFPDVLKVLGHRFGIDVDASNGTGQAKKKGDGVRLEELAAAKLLTVEELEAFGVVQAGADVVAKYRNDDGTEAARHRCRTALRTADGITYWTGQKDDGPMLPYGLDRLEAARARGFLVLVEGESDCWAGWHHGLPTLGIPGATLTKLLLAEYLKGIDRVYVVEEPDQAGEAFVLDVLKRLNAIGWAGELRAISLAPHKDLSDLHVGVEGDPGRFVEAVKAAVAAAEPRLEDEFRMTDMGNARRFVERHGDAFRYVWEWKRWLRWTGRRWRQDTSGEVVAAAKDTVEAMLVDADIKMRFHAIRSQSERALNSMISLTRSEKGIPVASDELDRDPWLLNVANGTIDLRTGKLRDHNRADRITKLVPVEYRPGERCPRVFDDFLTQVFSGDDELIEFVRRAVGYSLTGLTDERVFFLCHGVGANGKSTLVELILDLLGDYGRSTPAETFMERKNEGVPNDVARLKGARLVTASETEDGKRLASARVKELAGGRDTISARFMRAEWFDFRPTFKIWLTSNFLPSVKGDDQALFDRIRLIPFMRRFDPQERDSELPDRLRAEMPGILSWAVQGCLDWQREGLGEPAAVKLATSEYQGESDQIGKFLEDECAIDFSYSCSTKELRKKYEDWCESNGESAMSSKRVGQLLSRRGFRPERDSVTGNRIWIGFSIRNSWGSD